MPGAEQNQVAKLSTALNQTVKAGEGKGGPTPQNGNKERLLECGSPRSQAKRVELVKDTKVKDCAR